MTRCSSHSRENVDAYRHTAAPAPHWCNPHRRISFRRATTSDVAHLFSSFTLLIFKALRCFMWVDVVRMLSNNQKSEEKGVQIWL